MVALVIGGGICDITADLRARYLHGVEHDLHGVEHAYHEHALNGFRECSEIAFSACGDRFIGDQFIGDQFIGSCHAVVIRSQSRNVLHEFAGWPCWQRVW